MKLLPLSLPVGVPGFVAALLLFPPALEAQAPPSPESQRPFPAWALEGRVAPQPFQEQAGPDRLRGALWGGGVGVLVGGILGGLSAEDDSDDPFGGTLVETSATGEAVILGALVGGTVGALLGATVFAPERRLDVRWLGSRTLGAAPTLGRSRVGATLRIR